MGECTRLHNPEDRCSHVCRCDTVVFVSGYMLYVELKFSGIWDVIWRAALHWSLWIAVSSVHTVACFVSVTVSMRNLFRERGSTHTEIAAVVQIDTVQSARLPASAFLSFGNPQNNFHIPWILCSWKRYTGQKTKRQLVAQRNNSNIANFRTFVQYFERDFELRLKIFVYVFHDFLRNP